MRKGGCLLPGLTCLVVTRGKTYEAVENLQIGFIHNMQLFNLDFLEPLPDLIPCITSKLGAPELNISDRSL